MGRYYKLENYSCEEQLAIEERSQESTEPTTYQESQ